MRTHKTSSLVRRSGSVKRGVQALGALALTLGTACGGEPAEMATPAEVGVHAQAGTVVDVKWIQDAINAAAPGSTISIPAGSYPIQTAPLRITKSITLAGAGDTLTTFIGRDSLPAIEVLPPDGQKIDVTLKQLGIRGGYQGVRATAAPGSSGSIVTLDHFMADKILDIALRFFWVDVSTRDSVIKDSGSVGALIESGGFACVNHTQWSNNAGGGVALVGYGVPRPSAWIESCEAINNSVFGFYFRDVATVLLRNSRAKGTKLRADGAYGMGVLVWGYAQSVRIDTHTGLLDPADPLDHPMEITSNQGTGLGIGGYGVGNTSLLLGGTKLSVNAGGNLSSYLGTYPGAFSFTNLGGDTCFDENGSPEDCIWLSPSLAPPPGVPLP